MAVDHLQPAYVLHTRRFRDSSLVVELLTEQQGRRAVLAKGVLGSRGAWSNLLQPFAPLLIAWRGRGELPLLVRCEAAAPSVPLRNRQLYCGMYVNELILRLCEQDDPHSELLPAYASCIGSLAEAREGNAELEPLLRRFELALLQELGIGMQLQYDQDGQPLRQDLRYRYLVDAGPVATTEQKDSYRGATLLGLASGDLAEDRTRNEARALMRRVLDFHLGGRPLKSRELFQ